MQNKAIAALANAISSKTFVEAKIYLEFLESKGWKLVNPDLEEQEFLAQGWEDKESSHHLVPGECSYCDQRREAWEAIHGPSQ